MPINPYQAFLDRWGPVYDLARDVMTGGGLFLAVLVVGELLPGSTPWALRGFVAGVVLGAWAVRLIYRRVEPRVYRRQVAIEKAELRGETNS